MTSPSPDRELVPDQTFQLDHDDEPVLEPHIDPVFTGKKTCAIHSVAMLRDAAGTLICPECVADWDSTMKLVGG